MKVLQTSGPLDVKIYNTMSSDLINERLSLDLPFAGEIPHDLTAIIQAWGQLPEVVKAGIIALVNASIHCEH